MRKRKSEKRDKTGSKHKTKKKPENIQEIVLVSGVAVILLITMVSTFILLQTSMQIKQKAVEAKEAARPANVEAIIFDYKCPGCDNVSEILESLEGYANITSMSFETEGPEKYNITRLPAIVLKGEVEKDIVRPVLERMGARFQNGVAIIEDSKPPYYLVNESRVAGFVRVKLVTCDNCSNIEIIPEIMNQSGIYIISIEFTDGEGYGLETKPAAIFSSDIRYYTGLEGLRKVGNEYVYEPKQPPYLNLSSGRVEGLVEIIYLVPDSCNECYNVTIHRQILSGNGVYIARERFVSISSDEGRDLVKRFKITAVPTIIASKELSKYPIARIWSQVGTVENGWYVFRSTDFMQQAGGYMNVTS